LTDQGALTEALDHLRRAVRLNPGSAMSHFNLGLALEKLDRLAEAEQSYETVLALAPAHVPAHYQLGRLQLRSGRPALAVGHLEAVVRLYPPFEDAERLLAEARAQAVRGRNP
jgi:Flp pilus assembly protein TadD